MAKSKTEGRPVVHEEMETRFLRCNLTDEQFQSFAAQLAEAVDNCALVEEEAKAAKAELKSRADKAAAELGRLNNIVRNKYQMTDVEVTVKLNFTDVLITVMRNDTGEVIESRKMMPGERDRQAKLFPPEAAG